MYVIVAIPSSVLLIKRGCELKRMSNSSILLEAQVYLNTWLWLSNSYDSWLIKEVMLSIDGWSNRSVAGNSALSSSLRAHCNSVAPRESIPAAIKGASTATSVPSTSDTQPVTFRNTLHSLIPDATNKGNTGKSYWSFLSAKQAMDFLSLLDALRSANDSTKHVTSNAACAVSKAQFHAIRVCSKV